MQPQGIWLRCDISHRAFWPSDAGDFNLSSLPDYSQAIVEGPQTAPAIDSAPGSPATSAVTGPVTLSGVGPSTGRLLSQGGAQQWPGFQSVAPTASAAKKKGSHTLKVFIARMTGGIDGGGKPHFEKHDQIFISITEITACQPHILAAVREHAGDNYIIVTGDGLEVKDSSGTEGMYYKLLIKQSFILCDHIV